MERIATKWRKHLAVGVSPQLETLQISLATKWRQQFQPLLSPLRGFDSMFYSFLGLPSWRHRAEDCHDILSSLVALLRCNEWKKHQRGLTHFLP